MPQIQLAEIEEILLLYCKALTGKSIQIFSTEELAHRGIGWAADDKPTTEGVAIFLPPSSGGFGSPRENFDFYKVLVTHQASHLEYGTFGFTFDRSAAILEDCRLFLIKENPSSTKPISDFELFFDLFADRRFAEDLFVVAEDTRVDNLLRLNYKGLRQAHTQVRQDSATKRMAINSLPVREAFVEILVQLSLETDIEFPFPALYLENLRLAAGILRCLKEPTALVEDAAEATIRLYCLLAEIPNVFPSGLPTVNVTSHDLLNGPRLAGITDRDAWLNLFRSIPAHPELQGEKDYKQVEDVQFRGGLKPELVQTIIQLLAAGTNTEGRDSEISAEEMKRMVNKSVEVDTPRSEREKPYGGDPLVDNLLKVQERARHVRSKEKMSRKSKTPRSVSAVATAGEETSYYYDEWDFLANSYRPDWCRVRQTTLAEGTGHFYEDALRSHSKLAAQIKKQFSLLKPEAFKRMRGLYDGEDVDFDAVVEAMADRRAGQPPSERLYSQRRKSQRDVSVVFLLDMSMSTGEPITDKRLAAHATGIPGARNATEKRIIDIEMESLVLLTNALESIGDKYGIYGFSGAGRDNVQFFLIKGLNEDFSKKVKKRIDNIKPVRGTRIGPAIRHAVSILENQEAKTRLLILISDGRPQDLDYGQDLRILPFSGPNDHVKSVPPEVEDGLKEKQYVINDTRMALLEAKRKGIVPFCLSIDRFGHDYLRIMCGDLGYEVLDDVQSLPKHLPALYRRLTT